MHTSDAIQLPANGRKRGRYSAAFKSQLVAACANPGASTAAIALANGINANLLRRWISQHHQGTAALHGKANKHIEPGFVRVSRSDSHHCNSVASAPPFLSEPFDGLRDDRLHLSFSRGDLQAKLSLPANQHSQCAALLKLLFS